MKAYWFLALASLSFASPAPCGAQIVTAEQYLSRVSDVYAGFHDYEASIAIRSGDQDMYGIVSHKDPNLIRIDFTTPAEQVLVFTGKRLTVYLPEYRAVLTQAVSGNKGASGSGLSMLKRNFGAAFITGPDAVPLEEGSGEKVVKLRLTRRAGSEGFREIILSINPQTLLIRRVEGTTTGGGLVRFDFSNVKTNQGIPEQRFVYDTPASANVYNNFLFRDSN